MGIWIFFEDGYEEGLDGECLSHCCSQSGKPRSKRSIRSRIVALVVSGNHPNQKNQVSDDANDTVGHQTGPELKVFQHENQRKQDDGVDCCVDDAEMVRRDQSDPLGNDEFEVEQIDEDEVEPYADIVEYFCPAGTVEVTQHGVIQIGLVSHVQDAQIARVETEHSRYQNHNERVDISGSKCIYGQNQDQSSNHSIYHAYHRHWRIQHLCSFNSHYNIFALQFITTASGIVKRSLLTSSQAKLHSIIIDGGQTDQPPSHFTDTPPQKQSLLAYSVQDLVTGDHFNLQHLSKSTAIHPILINQQLHKIHALLTTNQPIKDEPSLELNAIANRWLSQKMSEAVKQEINLRVSRGDIVQIIGRTNSGKSYLLNQLVVQALSSSIQVIFLDSGNNLPALLTKIKQRLGHLPNLNSLKLKHFKFSSLSELFMLLHHIQHQIENATTPYMIFIDSIARQQQSEVQNLQTITSQEFKYAEKAKILLRQLSSRVRGIVYVSKVAHSITMFNTVYKHDKIRPKAVGSNSKQWDNIANKTFLVEYTATDEGYQHWWIHSSKSVDCLTYKLKRQS